MDAVHGGQMFLTLVEIGGNGIDQIPRWKTLLPFPWIFFFFDRVEREGFRFLSNEQEKRKKSKIENFQLEICLLKLGEELNRGK